MRKLKYGTLDIRTKKEPDSLSKPGFDCIACEKRIKINERYRYKIGREIHEHCLKEYMDSEGYVTLDEQDKPIKRI